MNPDSPKSPRWLAGRWSHRLAWLLACATFPLIWMGGLVTTYRAGMAVPDWPTTFHYWFYPLYRWLFSWSDLLLEHGHAGWFEIWVWLKLIFAALSVVSLGWLLLLLLGVRRQARGEPLIVRRSALLAMLLLVQLALGAATWVTHYGWPAWFSRNVWTLDYTLVAHGRLQTNLTTAHVAIGSLTLVASLSLTLWLHRLLRGMPR